MLKEVGEKIRIADYLVVAQLFLRDNFLLERPLQFEDIKPRLLGHWGTCHGINLIYQNLAEFFRGDESYSFILGPGHGFPALQANLWIEGKVDLGVEELCRSFSWPDGVPSHSNPSTPGVITEGGELGYALAAGFGAALGHPEKTIAVLIGDGELETATALASLNLIKLVKRPEHGKVIPILHLNGYKISGPTIYGRKSERELAELIRGFGYVPIWIKNTNTGRVQADLREASETMNPFLILKTEKGEGGPEEVEGRKIRGNCLAHQIPLPLAKTDEGQLRILENWLRSYEVLEFFDKETGRLK